MGQKRGFVHQFKERFAQVNFDTTRPLVFVDLFGGSGLLSHTLKQQYPEAEVIWNDWDNYYQRLNRLPETQEILDELAKRYKATIPKLTRFDSDTCVQIQNYLKQQFETNSWLDYITISCALMFNGNYADSTEDLINKPRAFYNRLTTKERAVAGYLHGVERVRMDAFELFKRIIDHEQQFEGTIILVLDPPYLSTQSDCYLEDYWRLSDFIPLMQLLKQTSLPYVIFGSGKSDVQVCLEWADQVEEMVLDKVLKIATSKFEDLPSRFNVFKENLSKLRSQQLHRTDGSMLPVPNTKDRTEYALDNFRHRVGTYENNK